MDIQYRFMFLNLRKIKNAENIKREYEDIHNPCNDTIPSSQHFKQENKFCRQTKMMRIKMFLHYINERLISRYVRIIYIIIFEISD